MKRLLCLALLTALPALGADDPANLEALRAAAEEGQPQAQYQLGVLYEFGFGRPDHRVDAYVWYSRAAAGGSRIAAERREQLRQQLDAGELERAQARLAGERAS